MAIRKPELGQIPYFFEIFSEHWSRKLLGRNRHETHVFRNTVTRYDPKKLGIFGFVISELHAVL